MTSPAVP